MKLTISFAVSLEPARDHFNRKTSCGIANPIHLYFDLLPHSAGEHVEERKGFYFTYTSAYSG